MYYLYYCNTEKSQSWPVPYEEYLPGRISKLMRFAGREADQLYGQRGPCGLI